MTARLDDVVEDVLWLLDQGEPPLRISAAMGRSPDSLAGLLKRHGYPAAARQFWLLSNQLRRAANELA